MTNPYKFSTPDHDYIIEPVQNLPKTVSVQSEHREALEEMLDSIHLQGVAEGENFDHLTIEEDLTEQYPFFYVELTRETLALYFQFETLNFMGAPVHV